LCNLALVVGEQLRCKPIEDELVVVLPARDREPVRNPDMISDAVELILLTHDEY
jgi:hypothetical protein